MPYRNRHTSAASESGAGIPLPPASAPALRAAILELAADPARVTEMGARGRRFVEAQYARPVLAAAYEDLGRLGTSDDLSAERLTRSRYERVLLRAISGRELHLEGHRYAPITVRGWSHVGRIRQPEKRIEALAPWQERRLIAQVPFADARGRVACILQHFRDRTLGGIQSHGSRRKQHMVDGQGAFGI